MIQLLLWVALSSGLVAPSDAHVTFTMRAAPLEKAVAEIARQSGANLAVDPPIAKELVILRLKDAPLADVKKRLAQTVDAEWTTQGANEVLTRTPEIERRRKQEAFAERVATWQRIIDGLKFDDDWDRNRAQGIKELAELRNVSGANEVVRAANIRSSALRDQSPHGRMLARQLQMIGAQRLAQLPNDSRAVYSSDPTRMQQPFGRGAQGLYKAFLAESRSYIQSIAEAGCSDNGGFFAYDHQFYGRASDTGSVRLIAETKSGRALLTPLACASNGDVTPGSVFIPDIGVDALGEASKPIPGFDKPIVNSEESVALKQAAGYYPNKKDLPARSLGIEILTHPGKYEVLAAGPSDVAIQAAEHRNLNMVAVMPDYALSLSVRTRDDTPVTLGTALAQIDQVAKVVVDEASGWLTVAPKNVGLLGVTKLPRRAVADLIAANIKAGRTTLDALARYCLEIDDLNSLTLAQILVNNASGVERIWPSEETWRVLSLYGSLSTQQRQTARDRGLTMAIGNMQPGQRRLVEAIVYSQTQDFTKEPCGGLMLEAPEQRGVWVEREPTLALPNGFPPTGTVTIRVGSAPWLFIKNDNLNVPPYPMSPKEAGLCLLSHQMHGPKPLFAIGGLENVTVSMQLPPIGCLNLKAQVNVVPSEGQWGDETTLPKEIQDAMSAEIERFRKSGGKMVDPNQVKSDKP